MSRATAVPSSMPSGPLTWLPNRPYGENVGTNTDLVRAREGGLDAQFFSIWVESALYQSGVPGQSRQRTLDKIEALRESISRNSGDVEFADTVQDVERIVSKGKLAAL